MQKGLYLYIIQLEEIPSFQTIFKIEQFADKYFINGVLIIPSEDW